MPVEDWLPDYQTVWDESGHDPIRFFQILRGRDIIDDATYVWEYKYVKGMLPKEVERGYFMPGWTAEGLTLRPVTPEELTSPKAGLSETISVYFATAFNEVLNSFWLWAKENVKDLFDQVWGPVKSALSQAWDILEPKLEWFGNEVWDKTVKGLLHGGQVTPEDAPGMAAKMFGVALSAGITAHALSVASEVVYPTKQLGINQAIGMIADLASFGPISAATLGQVHYAALRRPMGYAVNKVTRSNLPDEKMLSEMVFEGVLSKEEWFEMMKYHGYADRWLDKWWPTMRPDPRYFELSMMAEDQAASDAWLDNRVKELGYEDDVNPVMFKGLIKKATRTLRQDYYKQSFNLFKEGYIQREHFNRMLDELEFRPEARAFAIKSAELAYLLDTISDEVKYWIDAYLKDLVTESELELQLSLLGLNRWRVDLKIRQARVRKYKKPAREEAPELEKVMNQARARYSQAYITLYRNDQLDSDTLYAYLLELGIAEELAEATVFLEEARKLK